MRTNRWKQILRYGWLIAAVVLLGACGDANLFDGASDPSGAQAEKEQGLAALDQENWDEAIEIFSAMDTSDPEVRKYLASAYLGKAGFDTLDLVDRMAQAQETGQADSVAYEAVTDIFDEDGDGQISATELEEKLGLVEKALAVFGVDVGGGGAARMAAAVDTSGLTDDEIFQAGVLAAIHAVLGVVEQLEYPEGSGNYLLTVDELRKNPAVIDGVTVPDGFDDDLAWVREAVGVLSPELLVGSAPTDGNDIAEDFDRFLRDIGYLPDEQVTATELRDFLHRMIQ
ncbi:MAG: hypothetical protein GXP50_05160 [Deltaproteobacteria bacterium]|nr:hypothetical protein [Deltaproteobacteria bacterium]